MLILTIIVLLAIVGMWAIGDWRGKAGITAMVLVLWVLSLAHMIPA